MRGGFFRYWCCMTILLLGATGLLGRNVLNTLLEKGHHVVVYVRNDHGMSDVSSANVTVVKGLLTDHNSLCSAAAGCQAVINCAGTTDMSLLRYEDYLPINADLCRSLVNLLDTTGIKTLVHVSSANTIGYGTQDQPGDETVGMKEPFASSYYARSKRQGEIIIEEVAKERPDSHIVILNPGFMVGAWDMKPSSGQLLLAAYRRSLMVCPSGGKSFVAVRDVASAVVAALEKGRSGERYLLTGEDLSIADFYRLQSQTCGYRQKLTVLPRWIVSVAGMLGDFLRMLHIPLQLSSVNVRQLSVMEYYSNRKAVAELGFTVSPISDAIRDFFYWRNTYLKK